MWLFDRNGNIGLCLPLIDSKQKKVFHREKHKKGVVFYIVLSLLTQFSILVVPISDLLTVTCMLCLVYKDKTLKKVYLLFCAYVYHIRWQLE